MASSDALSRLTRLPDDDVRALWLAASSIVGASEEDALARLEVAVDDDRIPTWACLLLFLAAWTTFLHRSPPSLRRLLIVFEDIEMRAEAEGIIDVTDTYRTLCPYLPELIEDDLDWTGFLLPGEE